MAQTAPVARPEPVDALPAGLKRWRFSVEDFHRMGKVGILDEDDRVELIDGEIIVMSPIGFRHAEIVTNLIHLFVMQAANRYRVSPQNPFAVNELSEFQPDVVLINGNDRLGRHPTSADIILVVEVSDTTLRYDLKVKLPRYARAGVPELWVVDVARDAIERFAEPEETGRFAKHDRFGREDEIQSVTLPDLRLSVRDILS